MKRHFALNLTVLATGLMVSAVARADEPQPQRGYFYFPPVKSAGSAYRPAYPTRPNLLHQGQQQTGAAARTPKNSSPPHMRDVRARRELHAPSRPRMSSLCHKDQCFRPL